MTIKKCKTIFLAVIMLFIGAFSLFLTPFMVTADTTTAYSDVLDDLEQDPTFDLQNYPAYTYAELKENELPLMDVISLAESENKELFIYVYNPTRSDLGLTAYQISMYCSKVRSPKEFSPVLYDLSLVSFTGVFDKYVVKNFEVSEEADRYYNIIELSRPFNTSIDTSIENGTTDDKAIPIGKQWHCYYYNDDLIYEMGQFKTLEIEVIFNGNIYHENGVTIGNLVGLYDKCNSWFVAFNAENYIIEKIYDADLTYGYRDVVALDDWSFANSDSVEYTPAEGYNPDSITITSKDTVTFEGEGLFAETFKWNRISSSADFVASFEEQGGTLTGVAREKLLESQWVFAYTETECRTQYLQEFDSITGSLVTTGKIDYYTEIAQVDIIRISFLDINGHYYNLGVVGDKTTADNLPDGQGASIDVKKWIDELWEKIWQILLAVVLFFVIWSFMPSIIISFIKAVLRGIGLILKKVFKIVFKVLFLPFRLLFKRRDKKQKR